MRRLFDVTEQVTHPDDWDFVGNKYFDSFKHKKFNVQRADRGRKRKSEWIDLSELMNERKEHTLKMFEEEPEKSVFEIADKVFLPVRVVRQLKNEFELQKR